MGRSNCWLTDRMICQPAFFVDSLQTRRIQFALETVMATPAPEQSRPDSSIVRVAPTPQLSRRGLILSFGGMIAIGLGVYSLFPDSIGGPPLPVTVTLDDAPVETIGGNLAVVTQVVIITSQLDQPIKNLGIELNGNYQLLQASPLEPGETLVLPLEIFTAKRSSRRFDPQSQSVTDVIVRGQLPNRARGVSKFEFSEQ